MLSSNRLCEAELYNSTIFNFIYSKINHFELIHNLLIFNTLYSPYNLPLEFITTFKIYKMNKTLKLCASLIMTLLFISFFTSCNNKAEETNETVAESSFNITTAKEEIVNANKEFMKLFADNDSIGLSNLYSQDAKLMMNGTTAILGRKNIQSTFSGIMNSGISNVSLKTIDVWGTENLITEEGGLSLFVGDTVVDQGKYIVLWKKEDGKWKLFRDIFNSNLPAQ